MIQQHYWEIELRGEGGEGQETVDSNEISIVTEMLQFRLSYRAM